MREFLYYGIAGRRLGTDGNGITDLVALAGCPLGCRFCINKELLATGKAERISPENLLRELMRDACYFIATEGGAALGGGEPLLQAEAVEEFCGIKPNWMRVSIETSLHGEEESVRRLIPFVDEWIVDVKSLDEKIRSAYAPGGDFGAMRRNLKILSETVPDRCRIRIPIIPDFKTAEAAEKEEEILKKEGFRNTEVFRYVLGKNGGDSETEAEAAKKPMLTGLL